MLINTFEKEKIKDVLLNDGVIAFVTDTVWGLGCIPESEIAVEKIYGIKHRDKTKPLILMSGEIYPLLKYVSPLSKTAHMLIKKYFPGALTIVVSKSDLTYEYITSKKSTVGIRVPDNELFAEICSCAPSKVLATTSANISSRAPALTYDEVLKDLGGSVDYIVNDYGYKASGCASTVLAVYDNDIRILREGACRINLPVI